MNKRLKEKVDKLAGQLEPDESIEEVAMFQSVPLFVSYLCVCIVLMIAGRMLVAYRFISIFTGLASMWLMFKAAQAFFLTQNSCVLVTNLRTFGYIGNREVCLPHTQVKRMVLNRVLFLDGGDAQSSILLRHTANRKTLYQTISRFGGRA